VTHLAYQDPGEHLSESVLLGRAQAGDVRAFECLASIHADQLYSVVLRLVRDRAEAEDVLQEALLRAWRGLGRFESRSLFFTWLCRIAINEANRALENHARRGSSVDIDDESVQIPAPANLEPANQAASHELQAALDTAIARLAPPFRAALVLRDIEGVSTRDAAEIVGVGEAAFKSRLHTARVRVRAELGDELLAPSADAGRVEAPVTTDAGVATRWSRPGTPA
jgi:RNA polymerase sigma-70 factor, ECF subfamily